MKIQISQKSLVNNAELLPKPRKKPPLGRSKQNLLRQAIYRLRLQKRRKKMI